MQITIHDVIPKATLNLPMKRGTMAHRQREKRQLQRERNYRTKNFTICGRHSRYVFTIIRSSWMITGLC